MENTNIIIPNHSEELEDIKQILRDMQLKLDNIVIGKSDKATFTLQEAAVYMGVSVGTIRNLCKRELLSWYQPKGLRSRVYIEAQSVYDFVANSKKKELEN